MVNGKKNDFLLMFPLPNSVAFYSAVKVRIKSAYLILHPSNFETFETEAFFSVTWLKILKSHFLIFFIVRKNEL